MNHNSNVALVELDRSLDDELVLHLVGPLRLVDREGAELTPRSRKAQGILALLGTSPGLRRSRAWLQDKLWSDRGPEQGAGSLRQCLTEIRLGLGRHVDCLRTEAGWVVLDPAKVQVRAELTEAEALDGVEFLEGLDIRDPEFEHWIRDQRLHCQQRTARLGDARRRMAVGLEIRRASRSSVAEDATSEFVLDQVAHALLGFANVDVIDFRAQAVAAGQGAAHADPDWLIDATASVWGIGHASRSGCSSAGTDSCSGPTRGPSIWPTSTRPSRRPSKPSPAARPGRPSGGCASCRREASPAEQEGVVGRGGIEPPTNGV